MKKNKIMRENKNLNHDSVNFINALNKSKAEKSDKGDAVRLNQGKLRYDLVNPQAHEDMVQVLTDGAEKYNSRNWEKGFSWTSVLASLKRHISAFERGEDYDPESGRLHLSHAACNVHFLNSFYYIFPQGDDRPKPHLKRYNVGLDIDGLLANFSKAWNKRYPEIDINPNSWYFDYEITDRFNKMKKDGVLDDFYLSLEMMVKPEEIPFDPKCYITSRPVDSRITQMWLKANGYPTRKVITVPVGESKVKVAKDNGVEIFVDDNFDNFMDMNENDILCYLFDRPWNKKYDVGHLRVENLKLPIFTY